VPFSINLWKIVKLKIQYLDFFRIIDNNRRMKEKKMIDIENASLLNRLREEMDMGLKGGIYHFTQIKLCYNSNRIEGSRLSEDQTRYIYDTNTVNAEEGKVLNVDDIIETINHFACFRYLLKTANELLNENIVKEYHRILKTGTYDSQKEWFKVGDYKKLENMAGGMETASPENVSKEMNGLLENYYQKGVHRINDIITFHHVFESIHPFQDGNGRVGRLILFKECLKNNLVPFIIDEDHKLYYYRGLKEYKKTPEYLIDTCLSAQDSYKEYLKYYKIPFTEIE
jgi:Fic family protein